MVVVCVKIGLLAAEGNWTAEQVPEVCIVLLEGFELVLEAAKAMYLMEETYVESLSQGLIYALAVCDLVRAGLWFWNAWREKRLNSQDIELEMVEISTSRTLAQIFD